MAQSERWTDKYPHKADAGDEYYFVRRKDRNDVVIMGFSMGKAWLNGVSYEPSELRSHLFLGPLSPSDAEQLSELRKAMRTALNLLEEAHRQYQSEKLMPQVWSWVLSAIDQLRALNSSDCGITIQIPESKTLTLPQDCGDANCPLHGDHPNTSVASPVCSQNWNARNVRLD